MAVKAKCKCSKCPKSFPTEQGLNLHVRRSHTAAGKTWGKGKGKGKTADKTAPKRQPAGSTKEKIRRVLANHPKGLQVKNIIRELRGIGYRGSTTGIISQTCMADPEITRIERGVYRLKNPPTPEVDSVETMQHEVSHSVPALLVRIEQLEKERDALRNAHLTFVREVGA